jgi:hypothetical protein
MKLFIRFSIFISFIILFYSIYRSEIFENGLKRNYYLPNFYISIFLIIFFITLSNINKEFQKYFVIIFMSIVLTLYCFEGYLDLKKNNFDKRHVYEVYKNLKKNDPEIVTTINPQLYLQEKQSANYIFTLSGISNVSTIMCNENGYYSIYKSDRYGFNNPDNQWEGGEVEYLLVGDSFTHGHCVNRPNDIASILRTLSNKKVLNLGYGGNGPLIEYATLREYLDKGVKKVLWLYFEGNDLLELNEELKYSLLNKYLNDMNFSQNLKSKQNQINKLAKTVFEKEVKTRETETAILENTIVKFIKLKNLRDLFYKSRVTNQPELLELQIILKLADELVKKNNSQLFFIYLPSSQRYKIANPDSVYKKNMIKKIVNNLNISFIDIDDEVFKKEENYLNLFAGFGGHYNETGYKKVSLKIYETTK